MIGRNMTDSLSWNILNFTSAPKTVLASIVILAAVSHPSTSKELSGSAIPLLELFQEIL